MPQKISILIPTHNRYALLRRTLESIEQLVFPAGVDVELIVVANACSDDTANILNEWSPPAGMSACVVEESEPGLNIARSRAVEESTGDVCAFLDDDVLVDPRWLAELDATYRNYPADLVGGRVDLWWEEVQPPDWQWPGMNGLLSQNNGGPEVKELYGPFGVIGANFSFKRSVYDAIGAFRPDLDRRGKEMRAAGESEFIQRALRKGFRCFYSPGATLKHWVPSSRVTPEYLTSVARGNAYSRILMREATRKRDFLRSMLGYGWLFVSSGAVEVAGRLMRNKKVWIRRACIRSSGAGGIRGNWQRLMRSE